MLKSPKSLVNARIFMKNYQHLVTVFSVERKQCNLSSKFQHFYNPLITRSFPHFNLSLWKKLSILDLFYEAIKIRFVVANGLDIDVNLFN